MQGFQEIVAMTFGDGNGFFPIEFALLLLIFITFTLDVTLLRFKTNHFANKKCSDPLQNTDGAKQSYNQTTQTIKNVSSF